MSRPTREDVFSALFARLQTASGFNHVSRRLRSVEDTPPESMPAVYQVQGPQKVTYKGGVPAVYDMQASWVIQSFEPDPTAAPSTKLNELIEAASAVLDPDPGFERQTLGGLVEYAAVEGTIDVVEGVLGDRAVAVLPVRIILAGF